MYVYIYICSWPKALYVKDGLGSKVFTDRPDQRRAGDRQLWECKEARVAFVAFKPLPRTVVQKCPTFSNGSGAGRDRQNSEGGPTIAKVCPQKFCPLPRTPQTNGIPFI